jgi:three-Cys-motif partner protein
MSRDPQNKSVANEFFQPPLFPNLSPALERKLRRYKRVQQAIWTHNKAHFIAKYLQYFVQITKHGTYIDGFAGPQSLDRAKDWNELVDEWAAALVLASEPKWLRQFFLCELSKHGVQALRKLEKSQPPALDKRGRKLPRSIKVLPGDFNATVDQVLENEKISQKEATFCLLDQRTFECHWATVQKLAGYKKPPHNKIELLYFLGVGWLHRAFSGIKDQVKLEKWWGGADWRRLLDMSNYDAAELVRKRFEEELGYRSAAAYAVYDRDKGNRVMYYMIHGSDHDEAPALMVRAHHKAVRALPSEVQTIFKFTDHS